MKITVLILRAQNKNKIIVDLFMKYELQVFENIIHGNFSPFISNDNHEKYYQTIQKKHSNCFKIIIATFKSKNNKFTLIEKTETNSLNPFARGRANNQQDIFINAVPEDISSEMLKILGLKRTEKLDISYMRQSNKSVFYIRKAIPISEIPLGEIKYYYYNELLNEEVIRIKETIKENVFHFRNNEDIEHYIHILQQALTNLSFQYVKFLNLKTEEEIYREPKNFSDSDISHLAYILLEDLLRYIENNFLKYIDKNIQIPARSALVKIYKINEKLETVKPALLNSGINAELLKIIYEPFIKPNAITVNERITYKELIYFTTYLDVFYQEVKNSRTISEEQVSKLLYQTNFNSFELLQYKTKNIQLNTEKFIDYSDKVDYLYHSLKTVNQRQCKQHIAYDSLLPSLKNQLTAWLEEEINYLNKKLQVITKPVSPNLFTQHEKVKIQVNLSVGQLAYFHKLMFDSEMIAHKNQRDVLRHISESYSTSKVTDISLESLSNKYYVQEQSDIDSVKGFIIQMLNKTKQM